MVATTTPAQVGFSTGAVARGRVDDGIEIAAAHAAPAGGRLVELSALHADGLDSVLAAAAQGLADRFERVSVHAPVKGTPPPAPVLVARLAAPGCDVVAHPDAMLAHSGGGVEVSAALGARLLVENNDGRKDFGSTVGDLTAMFDRLPDARMCLDVSHALHAGGVDRVLELVDSFGDRIAQLHVGCACGEPLGFDFDAALLDATAAAVEVLGWAPPTVLERAADGAAPDVLAAQRDGVLDALS